VQPRAEHPDGPIRNKTYHLDEAISLCVSKVLKPIEKIKAGETVFCATEKACQWCKAAGDCPALAEKALAGVRAMFTESDHLEVPTVEDIKTLTAEQKASVMEARGLFKKFMAAIEEDVETIILSGGDIPGFKAVAGRSNRKFRGTDDETETFCKDVLKLKPGEYTKRTLLGPAPIEKLIDTKKRGGKAKLEQFKEQVIKPEGKPTIVPESDKRPSLAGHFQEVTDPLA
jgi:hypothetical protein